MTEPCAVSFCAMQSADVESVAALARRADRFSWTVPNFLDALKAGDVVSLARTDDGLVGFFVLRITLDESELMDIAVDPAFQGKGFGRRLLNEAIKTAKLRAARCMRLEVRVGNERARRLYASSGFQIDAVRKAYYRSDSGREDAVLMTLNFEGT